MEFNRKDATSIGRLQELMVDQNLKCNLAYKNPNFGTLPENIIRIESSGRPLEDSI